jgi:mono/diheme cytochrome c family protein
MKNLKILIVIGVLMAFASCGNSGPADNAANVGVVGNTNGATSSPASNATPADELAVGRSLYKQNCAACHKEDGTGGKVTIEGKSINAENLTEDKFKRAEDAKLAKYIHDGVEDEGMPAFKDKLSEAQIREVVTYIRRDIHKFPDSQTTPNK